ncbi:MAG: SusC/RagA family TonB-linked outer membrane protein [Paludibacteraceae bacterium]|nr:SusC/RagA family TonB-linked outer membrane protein [Paludibacteraceae bacterium]
MKELVNKIFILLAISFCGLTVNAQNATDNIIRGKVYSALEGGLIGANVIEIDKNERIYSSAVTDYNGDFSMKIKNPSNKLKVSYVGYNTQIVNIGTRKVFNFNMVDAMAIKEVVVSARKMTNNGTLDIPTREISMAMQTISTKEFEGLSVVSVDDALQGRISGLDIVSNSGDAGSGSSMRIRGITSINSSSEPLIVLNGVIFETPAASSFEFATANQEQFADLLSVNVDDIESITVLKDAASTAVWGSRGANGVISIVTKKGVRGKTRVQYSYRFSGAVQPRGMKMLTGDDYTMFLKESYFNPTQSDRTSNIRELNYDPTFSEYENYNNNTDWVQAVTQFGSTHDHYVQLSGGGERARFLVSGGYYDQTGSVIGQNLKRYSTRINLDYNVSRRIRFSSEFSFTDTNNKQNYDGLLGIAYRIMPNMSIYAQDAQGNNTDRFYKMLPTASNQLNDQKGIRNPVASANLATKLTRSVRILPTFRIQYDLLDPEESMLRYKAYVAFDVNNGSTYSFLPKELTTSNWQSTNVNSSNTNDSRNLSISTDNNITWVPKFETKDHSLMLYGSFQLGMSSSRYQNISAYGTPTGPITGATAGGNISNFATGPGQGRWMAYMFMGHYVLFDKYVADITIRRDGSTKFGDDRKWGTFPGVSFAWNVADEDFMNFSNDWLSTLKFRPSWGITGNQPGGEYLFYSLYSAYSSYVDVPTIRPENIQLTDLRWEKVSSFNYGVDFGFLDDKYTMDFNYYSKRTEDMLFRDLAIPSTAGYGYLSYQNAGIMDNVGWELNMNANKIIRAGDFSMGVSLNFSNYVNTIIDLKQSILDSYNKDFDYSNGSYLTRIQENNSFGSIYGFRHKGVYQYNEYEPGREGISPFALDENRDIIRDAVGDPVRMTFAAGESAEYKFKGGDAIYEDINHDGNINELDIVYLGNSNPYFNGGLTLRFNYKRLSANIFSNFRVGNKIVNRARMLAENMYSNNNQAASVNWRWRKDGDITPIPRALYQSGYNWLGSDRYVEDGSFFRVKNLQVNYMFDPVKVKPFGINSLSLYLTINNLLTFTNYSGVDPEVGYGSLGVSTDNSQTPRSRSFTAGVSISF